MSLRGDGNGRRGRMSTARDTGCTLARAAGASVAAQARCHGRQPMFWLPCVPFWVSFLRDQAQGRLLGTRQHLCLLSPVPGSRGSGALVGAALPRRIPVSCGHPGPTNELPSWVPRTLPALQLSGSGGSFLGPSTKCWCFRELLEFLFPLGLGQLSSSPSSSASLAPRMGALPTA